MLSITLGFAAELKLPPRIVQEIPFLTAVMFIGLLELVGA